MPGGSRRSGQTAGSYSRNLIGPDSRETAVLLNGPRASADPKDFASGTYGQRGGGITEGFELDGKVLEFVYAKREPCMSNDVMPAIMCAPLIPANWAIIGVIYPDTCELGSFEMDDLGVLKTLSKSAAKLIHKSLQYQAGREQNEIFQQLLNPEPPQEN